MPDSSHLLLEPMLAHAQGYTRAFPVGATFLFAAAIVALLMLKVGNEAGLEDAATNPGK